MPRSVITLPSPSKLLSRDPLAGAVTVVEALAVLLAGLGSGSRALAFAVFVIVPAALGRTMIFTVESFPAARLPRLHVTVAVPEQLPWLGATETRETVAGSLSVSVTPVAPERPMFLTVTV